MSPALIANELDLLQSLTNPARHPRIIELGCGAARLARELLERFAEASVTALEVDERQLADNRQQPHPRLNFVHAGAQACPVPDASFDLALMLKSLHHVPLDLLDQALGEVHRVLRPGGFLYVSEPVFAGAYNEVIRIFHNEEKVRAAALGAVQRAVASGGWQQVSETHFLAPVKFRDFAEFEQRMIGATYANHRLDAATLKTVRERFEAHLGAQGAYFEQPMRVNLLCRL